MTNPNLPENSILQNVKIGSSMQPPKHLLRIFNNYLEAEKTNPSMANEISFEEFGEKWLALFNYGAHDPEQGAPLMDWVSQVAGSPYRPVKLMRYVDGQYIQVALIPPLYGDSALVIKHDERDYFGQLAARQAHQVQSAHRAREANAYIERNFTSRIDRNLSMVSENFLAMNEIFKLYGVEREIPEWIKNLQDKDLKDVGEETKTSKPTPTQSMMIEED